MEEVTTEITEFEQIGLQNDLLRGIFGYGFTRPSLIQIKVIPAFISGKEIVAQSQSGTGKTGAFVISVLQLIDRTKTGCQSIIISPTRELAIQICDVTTHLNEYLKYNISLCVGGRKIGENIQEVQHAQIVIGTPGRINDLIKRNYISNKDMKMLVLDEADELLKNDFQDQIKNIIMLLHKEKKSPIQICLFSATYSDDIRKVISCFIDKPIEILIKKENLSLVAISQFKIDPIAENEKFETLLDIYQLLNIGKSIIYVNKKITASLLKEKLKQYNFSAEMMYSDMTSVERNKVLSDFRKNIYRVLISTDLLSRGIDIQSLSVVINYDFPQDYDSYLHRVGRSGRFGKKGVAINFVTKYDHEKLANIETYYKISINDLPENISAYI